MDKIEGKSAQWALIEACLATLDEKYANIKGLIALKNDGTLSVKDLETKTIKPLFIIHEAISKLLRDNNII